MNNWGQADISQRHLWFPREMTSERNKCRNCVLMTRHYPDLGSAFDWPCLRGKFASANEKDYPDLGSAFDWPCLRGKFASANEKDYPDLGSAFDWPCLRGKFASANAKHYPDLRYGISALLSQRLFRGETSTGIANVECFLRLVTRFKIHLHIHIIVSLPPFYIPILTVCRMFETGTGAATSLL